MTKINAAQLALRLADHERGASGAADGEKMRGKKLTLAVIIFMLVAGQAALYYMPNVDSTDLDQQAQTDDSPATAIK